MTDEPTVDTEHLEEALEREEDAIGLEATLEVDRIDLSTGRLYVTVDGDTEFETDYYIPDLLDWSRFDDAVVRTTVVDTDVAGNAAEPIRESIAEQENVDPEDIYIQSITAPAEVEYAVRDDLPLGEGE